MKSQARVVVIGGGIGGCSALYHLTQEGWTDIVLVERDELTSGTTWHSAAQCPNLAFNQLLILLRSYTIDLYKELADDPDYPINYHHAVGGMRLITDRDNVDACQHIISVAKGVGVELDWISPAEALIRNPLLRGDDLLGALWDPLDGDIDPAQLCQALARRSRKAGAEIYRHNPVTGMTQKANSEWIVHTSKGDIECEHVVVAAGYRANEVGALMNIRYPVIAMEHMYFVTDPIPELLGRNERVPMVRCPRDSFYMRQEKDGLLVGVYEYDCKTFGVNGIDPDFVNALCPDDLERCLPKLEVIFDRLPCLKDAGIKSIVNGPITYAADAGPLVGKQPGVRNLWSMNGLRVGIGEGGGYGKMLAQLMVHGETEWDSWQLDPRRITSFANIEYTIAKSVEDYQHEFQWHMPHQHRPAGRPSKTTSIYTLLRSLGAEFGVVNGWERVMYFKPDENFIDNHSYRFPNWHRVVEKEVHGLRKAVGLTELSGFNRYEIFGEDVFEWLDSLTCSTLSNAPGKVSLCYFLTEKGNISSEATITCIESSRFWFGSAATAEYHDMDWLVERIPNGKDINIKSRTNQFTPLVLAGPRTRELLASISPRSKWDQKNFPWLTAKQCYLGHFEVMAMAVSYSGEQAFEIHVANEQLFAVYEMLVEAGRGFGLIHFGMFAVDSMRLEKGYGHWKVDFISEFNPIEAGLKRFVDLEKEFPGKSGLQRQITYGNRRERVLIEVHSSEAPVQPGEAVFSSEEVIGSITSASWGYRAGKNLAMAYVDPAFSRSGTQVSFLLLGDRVNATVCESCLFDPQNRIPRGLLAE